MNGFTQISNKELSDLRRSLLKAVNFIDSLGVGERKAPKLSKAEKRRLEVQRVLNKRLNKK